MSGRRLTGRCAVHPFALCCRLLSCLPVPPIHGLCFTTAHILCTAAGKRRSCALRRGAVLFLRRARGLCRRCSRRRLGGDSPAYARPQAAAAASLHLWLHCVPCAAPALLNVCLLSKGTDSAVTVLLSAHNSSHSRRRCDSCAARCGSCRCSSSDVVRVRHHGFKPDWLTGTIREATLSERRT